MRKDCCRFWFVERNNSKIFTRKLTLWKRERGLNFNFSQDLATRRVHFEIGVIVGARGPYVNERYRYPHLFGVQNEAISRIDLFFLLIFFENLFDQK